MISPTDFDQLSAYLDDQLVPAEKAALEARLAAEPELRATLRELRLTVRALRALPPAPLPRSFVLTPAQVAAHSAARPATRPAAPARRPLAPALRVAAAFSALALAVVVVGDLRGGVLTASPVADVQTVLVTNVPAEAPADGGAAASETPAGGETDMLEFAASEAPTATEENATAGGDAVSPAATPEGSALLAPEPSVTATPSAERDAATEAPIAEDGTKNATVTETPIEVAVAPPAATPVAEIQTADDTSVPPVAQAPAVSSLRVIELGLAMLTVLFVVAAWLTRRSA